MSKSELVTQEQSSLAVSGKQAEINAAIDMHNEGGNRNDYKAKAKVRSAA